MLLVPVLTQLYTGSKNDGVVLKCVIDYEAALRHFIAVPVVVDLSFIIVKVYIFRYYVLKSIKKPFE